MNRANVTFDERRNCNVRTAEFQLAGLIPSKVSVFFVFRTPVEFFKRDSGQCLSIAKVRIRLLSMKEHSTSHMYNPIIFFRKSAMDGKSGPFLEEFVVSQTTFC
jgi:hypothetical protein